MAWGEKYRLSIIDKYEVDWLVKFHKDGYTGSVSTLKGTDDPIKFKLVNTSDDVFDPFKEVNVVVSVKITKNFELIDLYSVEDMHTYVEIYKISDSSAEDLFWVGYVNPRNYKESYDVTPSTVDITCINGLSLLQDILYNDGSYSGRRYESQIMLDILGEIGYTVFQEYLNIYEDSMDSSVDDSPMDQIRIDTDVFDGMYCDEVLKEILSKYNACIRPVNGIWTIYHPPDLRRETMYGRKFTAYKTKTSISYSPAQYITRVSNSSYLKQVSGGVLMIQSPFKKVTTLLDCGNRESWLNNWELKGRTFDDADNTFEDWINSSLSLFAFPIGDFINGEDKGVGLINNDSINNFTIYQNAGSIVKVSSESDGDLFTIEIEYGYYNTTGVTINDVRLQIRVAQDHLYGSYTLEETDETECEWSTETFLTIEENVIVGWSGWKTWRRQFTGVPSTAPIKVTLFATDEDDNVYACYKNIKLYATSTEVIRLSRGSSTRLKYSGPRGGFRPVSVAGSSRGTASYETVEKEIIQLPYEVDNGINGKEEEYNYLLGDVLGTGLDNVLDQFKGSLSILLSLTQAAINFVNEHEAAYLSGGVVLTSNGEDVIFTAEVAGVNFTGTTSITNSTGNLDGSVAYTQGNVLPIAQIDTITLSGSSGFADIRCNGLHKICTWDTDLGQTGDDFVTDHAAAYDAIGVTVINVGGAGVLRFTANVAGTPFSSATIIVNEDGNLDGSVVNTQANQTPVKRIDTITLSGIDGTAAILCDAVEKEITSNELPSNSWNTRGRNEADPILEIAGDTIADQYSRPKQLLDLPIQELTASDQAPHINLIGSIIDDLNVYEGDFEIREVDDWTKEDCTLLVTGGYSQYTAINDSSASDHFISRSDLSIEGLTHRIISIRYRLTAGTPAGGTLQYSTADHGFTDVNEESFNLIADGDWHILLLDMTDAASASDWLDNIITGVKIVPDTAQDIVVDFDWIGFSRVFAINRGNFSVRHRKWKLDLVELI